MTTIAERVARGAAWLDDTVPDWVVRIDLDRLDLASACNCILGQQFGDYYEAVGDDGRDDDWAYGCGFLAAFAAECVDLTDEWRRLILARREARDMTGAFPVTGVAA